MNDLTSAALAVAAATLVAFSAYKKRTLAPSGAVAAAVVGSLVVIGAAITGVLAMAAVEALERSGLIRGDAALGLVYPALFSVGVILISRVGSVHLDVDAVLRGELTTGPNPSQQL